MKKGSTAAAKSCRDISQQQELTIGLDLGDPSSWYCVLDQACSVVPGATPSRKRRPTVFGHAALAAWPPGC